MNVDKKKLNSIFLRILESEINPSQLRLPIGNWLHHFAMKQSFRSFNFDAFDTHIMTCPRKLLGRDQREQRGNVLLIIEANGDE
jgi:hypothetical protein